MRLIWNRRLLSIVPPESDQIVSSGTVDFSNLRIPHRDVEDGLPKPKKKRTKGWEDEITDPRLAIAPLSSMDGMWECISYYWLLTDILDPLFTTLRTIETTPNPDGSATSHAVVRCTLKDIARATNLRVEDAAFALNECGLLTKRRSNGDHAGEIVISREMVEAVGKERAVKVTCMDLAHVLL
jgi:histone acetyltransferase MYST1